MISVPQQAVIEKFPTLVEIRDRTKKRVEEAKAKIKEMRQGTSKSQLQTLRKQIREKGLISTIKARREERLAKAKRSKKQITYPPAEEIVPPVLLYSQEEVPPALKIKTY